MATWGCWECVVTDMGVPNLIEVLGHQECGMAAECDLVCGRSQSFLWSVPWWQGWWRLGGGVGCEYYSLLCFCFLFYKSRDLSERSFFLSDISQTSLRGSRVGERSVKKGQSYLVRGGAELQLGVRAKLSCYTAHLAPSHSVDKCGTSLCGRVPLALLSSLSGTQPARPLCAAE